MEKLEWIKERFEKIHSVRRQIAKIDPISDLYENTANHIKEIYPYANTQL